RAGTGELVPAFSYRFVSGRAAPLRGEAAGRAALPLPRGVTGQLVLEADGLQPRVFEDLAVPPDAAPPLQLDVFLDPTRAAEGVTVWVRDADRRPVQDVRVDAFLLAADAPRGAWHLERPLWSRAASARDGRYRLPPLAPGRYGIRLTGVDEDGRPLPLTPSRRVFELTGGNGFVEDVTLEPACALQLDLVRPSGAAFRAAGRADVAIRLRAATEPALPRRWVSVGPDGARSSAVDRLPGPSPIWLAEATAPGAYVLEVAVDGVVQVQRQLVLAATAQTERVVLP
ncbi:MAG: carboxypeptidase-like regulatory domain-containing protein, partial [Planctomycetota bacterium]